MNAASLTSHLLWTAIFFFMQAILGHLKTHIVRKYKMNAANLIQHGLWTLCEFYRPIWALKVPFFGTWKRALLANSPWQPALPCCLTWSQCSCQNARGQYMSSLREVHFKQPSKTACGSRQDPGCDRSRCHQPCSSSFCFPSRSRRLQLPLLPTETVKNAEGLLGQKSVSGLLTQWRVMIFNFGWGGIR